MQTRPVVQLCMWPCVQNPMCAYSTRLPMANPAHGDDAAGELITNAVDPMVNDTRRSFPMDEAYYWAESHTDSVAGLG